MKKVRQLAHHFFYNIAFVKKMIFLFCIGILGQYLAKTYLETKKRPIYIICETNEENENAAEIF